MSAFNYQSPPRKSSDFPALQYDNTNQSQRLRSTRLELFARETVERWTPYGFESSEPIR
jgi:hypothetical protein